MIHCIASLFAIVSTDMDKKKEKKEQVCNVTLYGLSLDASYFLLVKHTYFDREQKDIRSYH